MLPGKVTERLSSMNLLEVVQHRDAPIQPIVLNPGGQIMVESEPDKGARFIIELSLIPVFHASLSR